MIKNFGKHEFFLCILIAIYILYFTTASFLRHENFFSGKFDLGNMDQVVWNTINGKIFMVSNEDGVGLVSRLGSHADFILILISPLYLIWNDPRMLLLLQTVVLALGSVFIYLIARHVLQNKNVSLLFAFLFLLSPSVQFSNLYDFHAVTLATTFLLGSFYFLIKEKFRMFFFFAILSGLTKEQVWVIVGLMGLYMAFMTKKKLLGVGIFVAGLLLSFALMSYIIPQVKGSEHFAVEFYQDFGNSPVEIAKNVISSPQKTIFTITQEEQKQFLYQLFFPLGYLSLLSPLFLLFSLPDLTINLLSKNAQFHQIYYHYTATITPFIFISTIYGIKKVRDMFPMLYPFVIIYLLSVSMYSVYSFGPLYFSKKPNIDMFVKQNQDRKIIKEALLNIPQDAKVAATNNLAAHLSHREILYTIPNGVGKSEYVAFLLNDWTAQPSLEAQKKMAEDLKNNNQYKVLFEKNNFILFKENK